MEKTAGYDIFSILSKLTIIIPLMVIVIALIIKFNVKTNNNSVGDKIRPTPTVKPNEANKIKIDFIGPWQCNFDLNNSSISASIKDRKIMARREEGNVVEYYFYKDDCLYSWQSQKYSGYKYCGLSSGVTIIETMANFSGGLDLESLAKNLTQLGINNSLLNDFKTTDLNNKCQKKEFSEDNFTVPTNVLFKNATLTPTIKK